MLNLKNHKNIITGKIITLIEKGSMSEKWIFSGLPFFIFVLGDFIAIALVVSKFLVLSILLELHKTRLTLGKYLAVHMLSHTYRGLSIDKGDLSIDKERTVLIILAPSTCEVPTVGLNISLMLRNKVLFMLALPWRNNKSWMPWKLQYSLLRNSRNNLCLFIVNYSRKSCVDLTVELFRPFLLWLRLFLFGLREFLFWIRRFFHVLNLLYQRRMNQLNLFYFLLAFERLFFLWAVRFGLFNLSFEFLVFLFQVIILLENVYKLLFQRN